MTPRTGRLKPPYRLMNRVDGDGGKWIVNADGLPVSPEEIITALHAAASEKPAQLCPKCGTEMKSAGEVVSANLMQALREQHREDEAQRVCQHLWPHADKPMPAKWDCACGTRVYRSREDAIDD